MPLDGRGAVVDPGTRELLQSRDADAPVGHAGGEQDRPPGRDVAAVAADSVGLTLEPKRDDLAAERELDAENPCLLVGALGELGAGDPAGEAEVVADQRARARLPADRLALEHQRAQALRRRVHRGREPGRSRADDHQVEVRVVDGLGVDAEGNDDLLVARVDEHRPVTHADDRDLAGVPSVTPSSSLAPNSVPGEVNPCGTPLRRSRSRISCGARRGRLGDHRELERALRVLSRPLVQELGDRPVKLLLAGARGLEHVVVGAARRHRVQDRLRRRAIAPRAPVDQQRPLRLRVQAAHAVEQLRARLLRHPHVREHQRHAIALVAHPLEVGRRGLGRTLGGDPVVTSVAAPELGLGACKGVWVVVGDEQHRLLGPAHGPQSRIVPPATGRRRVRRPRVR